MTRRAAREFEMGRKASVSSGRKETRELGIEDCQRRVRLDLRLFERFLRHLRTELGLRPDALFVRFVTDAEMKRLNGNFRKKPKTTDVLSFPADERARPAGVPAAVRTLRGIFLGDIAISPTVALRNAESFDRTFEQEICILLLHGTLHLLGYDHETDRGEMERVEMKLRQRLGLA
jgi:probable rRNA maturation factor